MFCYDDFYQLITSVFCYDDGCQLITSVFCYDNGCKLITSVFCYHDGCQLITSSFCYDDGCQLGPSFHKNEHLYLIKETNKDDITPNNDHIRLLIDLIDAFAINNQMRHSLK